MLDETAQIAVVRQMKEIRPPEPLLFEAGKPSLFLAGSIEMVRARLRLVYSGRLPLAGSAACATIECHPGPVQWIPCPGGRLLLNGRKISYEVTRSRLGAPLGPQVLLLLRRAR